MAIDQINNVPAFAASGNQANVEILDFDRNIGVRRQENTVPILRFVYYCGAIGDDVEIWARPAAGSANTASILIMREDADPDAAEETNGSRFCYPIPVDSGGLPMRLYLNKTNALTPAAAFTIYMGWSDLIEGNR